MPTSNLIQYVLELWGAIFCVIVLAASLITQSVRRSRFKFLPSLLIVNSIMLVMDAMAWRFRGYPGALGYWMVRISNYAVFALPSLMYLAYFQQVEQLLRDQGQRISPFFQHGMFTLVICEQALLLISQPTNLLYYFDETNTYHRQPMVVLNFVLSYLIVLLLAALLLQKRKFLRRTDWLCLMVLPSLAVVLSVVQMMFYGLSLMMIGTTASVLLTFLVDMADQAQRIVKDERDLQNAKLALLRSQMQPHFMFNSLNTIRTLTLINPPEAANAITDFADFVRASLDTMDSTRLIDISDDLTITEKYLAMEKRRFGNYITVETDYQDTGFQVPAFTIQPMAENAIRHGLCKKVTPGTLTISTRREDRYHLIEIKDDGAGFDPSVPPSSDRPHIGVTNVRHRLHMMCRGTLEIESAPGVGTTVTIRIPV